MTSRLDVGLAVASTVSGVTITGPAKAVGNDWELPFEIDTYSTNPHIANVTPWIIKIDRAYPYGSIRVYPATNGMRATFQHQEVNNERTGLCRTGKLCLDSPYRNRTLAIGGDPVGNADARLAWHLARAHEWVVRAATGDLVRDGDPFEIPRIEGRADVVRIIHDESSATLPTWRPLVGQFGQVRFRHTPVRKTIVASKFTAHDAERHIIRTSDLFVDGQPAHDVHGIWWLWRNPIVLEPWRAATTWGELAAVGTSQGIDVYAALEQFAYAARKAGRGRLLLMLGYPIPDKIGGPRHEVHWETLRLPALSNEPPKGFRPSPKAFWQRDRHLHFGEKHKLEFVDTNSWHADRVQARGRLPGVVSRNKVIIIGCGALGSAVAELLVRAGLLDLTLIDGEVLEIGNVARHVLTSTSVGRSKADELANRLREISPGAKVAIVGHHLDNPQTTHDRLDDADVVIDCTGTDEIPTLMAETYWSLPCRFISASFGYGADRLFLFRSLGTTFPASAFFSAVEPWLAQERRVWAEAGEVTEGAGCYSPLFPARADDVAAGAVAVVKFIEETITSSNSATELLVLQASAYGGFEPIKSIEDVAVRAA